MLGLHLADAGEGDVVLRGPSPEHTVRINAVSEPKTVKHRMHLDVHARSVDELLALGATVVDERPRWTVMADPEGGEFCAFVREEPPPYRLYEVGLDADDAREVGRWWADLLGCGWQAKPLDGTSVDREAGEPDSYMRRFVDEGKEFVYHRRHPRRALRVPGRRSGARAEVRKTRCSFYVVGDVAEIVARGATVLDEQPRWTVMADVEGNEFCVFPPA